MIIGRGLIASALQEFTTSNNLLMFASGVSDSTETDHYAFRREAKLVEQAIREHPGRLLVYFSTYSIEDDSLKMRPYTLHKLAMEQLITGTSDNFLICRLSNIVGLGGNKRTIFNFLFQNILHQRPITVWKNATRNLLDVDDMKAVLRYLIAQGRRNATVNIANPNSYSVTDIIERIERQLGRKLVGRYINRGRAVSINIDDTIDAINALDRDFSIAYVDRLVRKKIALELRVDNQPAPNSTS